MALVDTYVFEPLNVFLWCLVNQFYFEIETGQSLEVRGFGILKCKAIQEIFEINKLHSSEIYFFEVFLEHEQRTELIRVFFGKLLRSKVAR